MTPKDSKPFFSHKRELDLLERFDPKRVPAHVAIIMDGNGRWASKRGLPKVAGHRAGAMAVQEAIASAIELGVRYLTIYSFSSENWRRPADEVNALMGLFIEVLRSKLSDLQREDVRVRVIGRLETMPEATAQAFREAVDDTKDNRTLDLVVALNYGGRTEIADAARALCEQCAAGELKPENLDEDALAAQLYTAGIPDPDIVVRTSGEMRISNFLLWQIAYAEFYVTPVLWPDFKRYDMLKAVVDYQSRERRFGGR